MSKTRYVVTENAKPMTDVAGKRRRPGDVVELTNPEAQFEILRGVIELEKPDPTPAPAIRRG